VILADGLLGFEAKNILKQLARLFITKWERRYSVVCGLVQARVIIACVRVNHLSVFVVLKFLSAKPATIQWSDGAGVGLFKVDQ